MVSNAAAVLTPIGADELDYMLAASGDLTGLFTDSDGALGGANLHFVTFDTTTPGMKTGTVTLSSTSQGVPGRSIHIPVSSEVIGDVLEGDFNGDGNVDAADYVVWRKTGQSTLEYDAWLTNFGRAIADGQVVAAIIPEPPTCLLITNGIVACVMLILSRNAQR